MRQPVDGDAHEAGDGGAGLVSRGFDRKRFMVGEETVNGAGPVEVAPIAIATLNRERWMLI